MKAVVRIQTKRRPTSGEVLGYRLQAAVPNKAGKRCKARFDSHGEVAGFSFTDEEVPSFRKGYMITESSDLPCVKESDFKRFVESLKWQGYKEFEFYGDAWEDVPFDLREWGGPLTEFAAEAMIPSIQSLADTSMLTDVPF